MHGKEAERDSSQGHPHHRSPFEAPALVHLVEDLRMSRLLRRFPQRPVWALFMLINGFLTVGVLSAVAMLTRTPFIFPSLGPTAFLFFSSPALPTATPRNTLIGHAVGIACGYGALLLTGLEHAPPATAVGVDGSRVLAAALSLALTGAIMILLDASHPPAGATTLIVSLGIVTRPAYLGVIELAVALLTAQAILINRLAGIEYPLWARKPKAAPASQRDIRA